MSDHHDWPENFRRRCESVGWRVELSASNHYKVYSDERGFLFSFSKTPGDRRALNKAVTDARRHGIEQLETDLKLRVEKERLERLATDREANERVLQKMVRRSSVDDERDGDAP